MREKYFSNIINLKLSKSKRLCLNIFQIKKKLLEKISRENIQKDPSKQTRSTRWLAVVLFVALLLTGLYLA